MTPVCLSEYDPYTYNAPVALCDDSNGTLLATHGSGGDIINISLFITLPLHNWLFGDYIPMLVTYTL